MHSLLLDYFCNAGSASRIERSTHERFLSIFPSRDTLTNHGKQCNTFENAALSQRMHVATLIGPPERWLRPKVEMNSTLPFRFRSGSVTATLHLELDSVPVPFWFRSFGIGFHSGSVPVPFRFRSLVIRL